MNIRTATSDDFGQIMGLYRQLQPVDPVLTNGEDRRVFDEILSDKRLHLFVVDDGEEIMSSCYLNIIPNITRSASPYAIIENVITDEPKRGLGLGKRR